MTTPDTDSHISKTMNASEKNTPSFSMADLPSMTQKAANHVGWTELMPVQTQTIPLMLEGKDIMVQSQTGSGKTGAFLLPILTRVDPDLGAVQALILAPTRELAVQVCRDAEELGRSCKVRALAIYGGVGYGAQIQGLEAGAQLIVGTPGRILDHLLKGTLTLDYLKTLVFDEADRMLSMGFYPDMKQLQRYLPPGLQSTMFSATYPGHVQRLAQQFLKDPVFVSLSQNQVHASDVIHVAYKVPAMQKSRVLVKIIEQENPASGIIFCNTKTDVHFVTTVLRRFGYDVGEISADLSQTAREEVLEKLRQNKLKFLVATDVAARGIDIHELSHVFQYQPPQDHEAYVHRTGRTGRAGAAGIAISLVSGMEEIELDQIAKKFSINLEERQVPADEDLELLISQRVIFLLESQLRKADNIQKERMQRFSRTVVDLAENEDSRTLLSMLIDDFYQKTFHAPLDEPPGKLTQAPLEKSLSVNQQEKAKPRHKRSKKAPDDNVKTTARATKTENQNGRIQTKKTQPAGPATNAPTKISSQKDMDLESTASRTSATNTESRVDTATVGMEFQDNEQPTMDSSQETPSKKRRRRRPRKTSAITPDNTARDQMSLPDLPPNEDDLQIKNKEAQSQLDNAAPAPQPPKKYVEQQRTMNNEQEQTGTKSTPKAAPTKSKKKIFLE